MEKLFNVPVELFRLEKIMINKQKVCKVNYTITDCRGDKNDVFSSTTEPNYQCTEELQLKLNELKPYLCDICHIQTDKRTGVNVAGVEMSGEEDKATFKIHGTQLSDSEQSMRFATCKVMYDGGNFGFEVDVANIIEDLQILAHGYIFENKKAVLSLGLQGASDNDNDEPENDEDFDEHEEVEETETDNE